MYPLCVFLKQLTRNEGILGDDRATPIRGARQPSSLVFDAEASNVLGPLFERIVADGMLHHMGFFLGHVGRNTKDLLHEGNKEVVAFDDLAAIFIASGVRVASP